MTRIAFVRHGRAIVAENLCIGHTDVPLSPEGADAVRALVACPPEPSLRRVISSDLRRASESATIIADAFGRDIHCDRRLREMNFGEWDGRSWTDIERDDGPRFLDWMDRWVDLAAPGGESAADVALRADEWIAETPMKSDDSIIVVSHAGWIRAVLCRMLGRDLARMFEIPIDYARATIVEVTPAGSAIVAANVAALDAIGLRSAPRAQAYPPSR
jgi:glucosyl-3-phosphoglycerate phosphatase